MAKRQRQATAKYIQFDAWVRTGNPKRCNAKTDHGLMAVNVKMLTRVLYKTATTLQHCDFVLLSKHSNHVKICRFSKVEDT